jgi:hypothetical protein
MEANGLYHQLVTLQQIANNEEETGTAKPVNKKPCELTTFCEIGHTIC